MRRLRIAILAEFPLEALETGATGRGKGQLCTWLPQFAHALESLDEFDVHWLVLDRKRKRRPETIESFGQKFHIIRGFPFSVDLATKCLPTRRALGHALRRLQPDLVHAWGTELIYSSALLDHKGPSILSMQGILTEYQRIGGLPDDWRWRRMVADEPAIVRSATIVTSESQWGIDRVREIHPQADCRMVEYGVHPDFFNIAWEPSGDVPYVLGVSGSGIRKGLDVLLEAMSRSSDRNWELRLAGDSGIATEVEAADVPGVRYLGMLAWPDMIEQLRHAWCAVLPTRGDTSPNSVKEARVIGLPVVTTRHGGQAGYIHNGVNGLIVEPLDATGLAGALGDVMSSLGRARSLGAGNHAEDRAYLAPSRTAEGFAAIYREIGTGA